MRRARLLVGLTSCVLIGLALLLRDPERAAEPLEQTTSQRVPLAPAVAARPPTPAAPASPQTPSAAALPPQGAPRLSSVLTSSAEESRLLWEAEEAAVASCMEDRGFTYVPTKYNREGVKEAEYTKLEAGDVDAARAVGYGLSEAMEHDDRPDPSERAFQERLTTMSPEQQAAYMRALGGVNPNADDAKEDNEGEIATLTIPDGPTVRWDRASCFARARREVYGDDVSYRKMTLELMVLRRKLVREVEQDKAWKQGLERWRSCMRSRGFTYEDPSHARAVMRDAYRDALAQAGDLDRLRQRELKVATADAECYGRAGLTRIGAEAEARIEQAISAEHEPLLRSAQEGHVAALERAEAMVED